jgi:hypothetical protein
MHRLYKPARGKEQIRGLFSYLTESVLDMVNFNLLNGESNIKYYHDLHNIPGYGKENLFDIFSTQDKSDFKLNQSLYLDIESFEKKLNVGCYDVEKFTYDIRLISEKIITEHFKPNESLNKILHQRHSEIDFESTVGVHRRATDICHHHEILNLDVIFSEIESNDFNNVFLMCDNEHDTNKFKERYGNKIITYDEFTSKDTNVPFFKMQNSVQDIHKHIEELVFGVYTLSKTKHFICTKSNISSFSILSNSELNFKLLNT